MADNTMDLAEILAALLPPGLVTEDPAAYARLAVLPSVPWEDIHKLWNSMCTPLVHVDAQAMLIMAARLYLQAQEVSGSNLRSPRAFLVACLGNRQAESERPDAREAMGKYSERPDLRPAEATSPEAISGRT